MKNLILIVTFIFSLSGGVYGESNNKIWVLITILSLDDRQTVWQSGALFDKRVDTFQTKSDCYTGLKDFALEMNKIKTNTNTKYKIEIIDDTVVRAKKRHGKLFNELHCVLIKLK